MKRIAIVPVFLVFYFSLSAQADPNSIVKIRIRYQSTFGSFPEFYEIDFHEKTVSYISPIISIPPRQQEVRTKKLNKKSWNKVKDLIDNAKFHEMDSVSGSGLDGAWYSILTKDEKGKTSQVRIWSYYAPEELKQLHALLIRKK